MTCESFSRLSKSWMRRATKIAVGEVTDKALGAAGRETRSHQRVLVGIPAVQVVVEGRNAVTIVVTEVTGAVDPRSLIR